MKTQKITSAILMLLASSTCALAAATADEALRMTATLQTYLGSEPGVVTVTPAGDGYNVALDATPYLKKITSPALQRRSIPTPSTLCPRETANGR